MVPPTGSALDDVFVMWLFVGRRLRWSQFIPWSALGQHDKATADPPIPRVPTSTSKDSTMNATRSLIAAIALTAAAAGSAFAQEATPDTWL